MSNCESKYKEAFERARKIHEYSSDLAEIKRMEYIFPELCKSDDVIRKDIINTIKRYIEHVENENCAPDAKDFLIKELEGQIDWLENQNKQNQQGKSAHEAIKEKKIDNRNYVKPRFKAGEWITHNIANFVFKVVNVGSYGYEVVSQQNFKKTIPLGSEDKYRLWSTEDAKPGDVLYCESGGTEFFIILKDISKNGIVNSYCRYNDSIGFGVDIPNVMRISDNPKPATKEQRDFLFQKMKESGYEWSEETHELKEIELTKNESEEELSDFEAALFSAFSDGWQQYLHGEEVDVVQWAKEHSTELLEVANQNHVTWSKADEVKINRIVSLLENLKVAENDILRKDINWLKSLRPQINVTDEELVQARKEAYNEVLDKIEYHDDWPTFDDGWDAAIWYLKKRNTMPQNQWKPSEEQITWLYRAADEASKDSRMKQILNELLSDLKKLTK